MTEKKTIYYYPSETKTGSKFQRETEKIKNELTNIPTGNISSLTDINYTWAKLVCFKIWDPQRNPYRNTKPLWENRQGGQKKKLWQRAKVLRKEKYPGIYWKKRLKQSSTQIWQHKLKQIPWNKWRWTKNKKRVSQTNEKTSRHHTVSSNLIKIVNTRAVPVVRYKEPYLKWKKNLNGSEDKKANDYAQDIRSERWYRKTTRVKKRKKDDSSGLRIEYIHKYEHSNTTKKSEERLFIAIRNSFYSIKRKRKKQVWNRNRKKDNWLFYATNRWNFSRVYLNMTKKRKA